MSDAAFLVRIGAGLYLDSNGMIRPGPDTALPTYTVSNGSLPVSPDTVKKVFDGIAKGMPDPSDPKTREKLGRLGVLDDTMKLLHAIGEIASVLGKVVAVVGFAVDVAKILGLLKDGPSAVEQLVERRYQDLDRRLKGMEIRWQLQDVRNMRVDLHNALLAVDGYLEELGMGVVNQANLQVKLLEVHNAHQKAADAVGRLLDASTWLSGFNRDDYTRVWPWIPWPGMYHMPVGVPAPNTLHPENYARFYDQAELVFDHRAMVPGVTYGVLSYLTLIKAMSPEYRSTGEFDDYLLGFADALEGLTEQMRATGLGRTVHVDGNFTPLRASEVIDPIFGPPRVGPLCYRWSAGAMDLRAHTNDYWDALEAEARVIFQSLGITPGWLTNTYPLNQLPDRLGPMWARWTAPAVLGRATEPVTDEPIYPILNIDECIAAANAQAEQDYLDLLFSSGYLNLAHLVALLRHNATEPDRSETVTGRVFVSHASATHAPVSVTVRPLLSEPIEATGDRESRVTRLGVDVVTQPLERERPLPYRITLCTMPSASGSTWLEPDWSQMQHPQYRPKEITELGGTTRTVMALELHTSTPTSEVELIAGASPVQTRQASGTATLLADTFDWWIPTATVSAAPVWQEQARMGLRDAAAIAGAVGGAGAAGGSAGSGGTGGGGGGGGGVDPAAFGKLVGASAVLNGPAARDLADVILDDVDPAATGGQHRDIRREQQVQLQWQLTWTADRMSIKLTGRPEDRNYVAFLVAQEKLGPSGQWLHTAFKLPVDGQLTYLPKDFFDRERAANERAHKLLTDLNNRYAKSVPVGPKGPGPLVAAISPAVSGTPEGLAAFLEAAATHEPELLREVLRDHDHHAPELDRRLDGLYRSDYAAGSEADDQPVSETDTGSEGSPEVEGER
ncbi:hypothetical protein ACFFWC_12120 [Plantactinospora siamensis]|uniref:Uncharacterized protein n=1 Tax=Plantactinospora siamensis TaxID=555372 RepID=A0ABV6P1K0_9ACTN